MTTAAMVTAEESRNRSSQKSPTGLITRDQKQFAAVEHRSPASNADDAKAEDLVLSPAKPGDGPGEYEFVISEEFKPVFGDYSEKIVEGIEVRERYKKADERRIAQ